MILRAIERIKYYIVLAIKKPRLILSFIFKKHLGVIILIPIEKGKELLNTDSDVDIVKSNDIQEISNFYKKMKRDSVNEDVIKTWLNSEFDCFLVYSPDGVAVGGMWVFKEKFTLKSTSGKTLSSQNTIYLDNESIYGAFVIIDENFRGRGINQLLLRFVIDYYTENSKYKKLLIITGASNGAYIRTTMKNNAKLIGITEVTNIFGRRYRKELFLDRQEKVWADEISF